MSGVLNAGSIRAVLSGPAVRRTFALALVGRLTYGLLPLCFLFTVRGATGSFAVAATASAALGLATLAMPVQARLVDRYGQRRVLPWYAAAYAGLLLATAAVSATPPPDVVWIGCGLLLGVTAPALGPAMRAQWHEIAEEGTPRRVAYSLDSVGEESLYLVGPLSASIVLATGPAAVGLVAAAGLVLLGAAALVVSPYVPAHGSTSATANVGRPAPGVLHSPGLRGLLLTMLLLGSGGAACFVGVAALADRAGRQSTLGIVEAAMATGAILAGLAWARVRREPPWTSALLVLVGVSAAAELGAALAAPSLLGVGAFLVVIGAVAAPVFVVAFTAADALVAPERRTEASTWVSTALNAGNAAGTALAGVVVATSVSPFVLGAALSSVALVVLTRHGRQK